MVTDTRLSPPTVTKPRINVNDALDQPVTLPPPTGLVATGIATGTVQITWNAPDPAIARTSYRLRVRATSAGTWTELANTTLTSFSHGNLTSATVYQYDVVTTDVAENVSAAITDYAMTFLFTDQPVIAGSTIRGVHIGELREAADRWRTFAGLTPAFGSYSPATGTVAATDVLDLVTALNGARTQIGLSSFSYTGVGAPYVAVTVDHRHIQQLRDVVR